MALVYQEYMFWGKKKSCQVIGVVPLGPGPFTTSTSKHWKETTNTVSTKSSKFTGGIIEQQCLPSGQHPSFKALLVLSPLCLAVHLSPFISSPALGRNYLVDGDEDSRMSSKPP